MICAPLGLLAATALGDALLVGGLLVVRRKAIPGQNEFDRHALLLLGLFFIALINVITFLAFLAVNPVGC